MVFFAQKYDNKNISVINSLNGEIINTFYIESWIRSFNIYPNENYTILAILPPHNETKLIFYNYETGKIIFELNYSLQYLYKIKNFIFTSNGEHLILECYDEFLVYKINVIDSNTISINQININIPILNIYKILPLQENNIIIKCKNEILLYDISDFTSFNSSFREIGETYLIYENDTHMTELEISPSYNLLAYAYMNKTQNSKLNIINFYNKSLITQINLEWACYDNNIKFTNKDESKVVILNKYKNQLFLYEIFTGIKLHTFVLVLDTYINAIIINYNSEEDKDILIISNNKNIIVYDLEYYSEKYTITSQRYSYLNNFKYISPLQLW